jgi:hypothetical protein
MKRANGDLFPRVPILIARCAEPALLLEDPLHLCLIVITMVKMDSMGERPGVSHCLAVTHQR